MLSRIGFATPFGEPGFKRLTTAKHRSKRLRILSAGNTCELTKKEGEIDRLGAQQIETFVDELDWGLTWEAKFRAEVGDVLAVKSFGIFGERSFGNLRRFTGVLRQ